MSRLEVNELAPCPSNVGTRSAEAIEIEVHCAGSALRMLDPIAIPVSGKVDRYQLRHIAIGAQNFGVERQDLVELYLPMRAAPSR